MLQVTDMPKDYTGRLYTLAQHLCEETSVCKEVSVNVCWINMQPSTITVNFPTSELEVINTLISQEGLKCQHK